MAVNNDETLIENASVSDDKKALATTAKMTQAVKATLEPNADLARLNPNRGTWERIEGRFKFVRFKIHVQTTELVKLMRHPDKGVPLKAVKSFLSRIPDVFTGEDLVTWLRKTYDIDSVDEAIHLGEVYFLTNIALTLSHQRKNNRHIDRVSRLLLCN